jgi:hypothetical protein
VHRGAGQSIDGQCKRHIPTCKWMKQLLHAVSVISAMSFICL